MKKLLILIAVGLPLAAQAPFDFKSLDKLDSLTEKKTKVTLDAGMLRLAAGFLGSDGDKSDPELKAMVSNLKGIYVRSWQFDKDGQYSIADVEPFRNYLKQQQWSQIVESRDGKELSEVYIQPLPNDRFGGVAVLALEARELTVVYISGVMNMSDLEKLSGNMGIPEIDLKGKKPATETDKKKKDEQDQQ